MNCFYIFYTFALKIKKEMTKRLRLITTIIAIIFFIGLPSVYAQEHENNQETKVEKFSPGDMIIDHVIDAHDWHIMTVGHHHISIPLPIIVYSKISGWNIFSSSHIAHGEVYKNFKLMTEGDDKGKIVEIINENLAQYFSTLKDTSEYLEFISNFFEDDFFKQNKDVLLNGFSNQEFGSISLLFNNKEVYYKPLDLSITKTVVGMWASMLILILVFIGIAKSYKNNVNKAPKGLQSLLEPLILFIRDDVAKTSIGEKKYEKYMPYLLTVFFFIFFNNLFGLIPIPPFGANITGNIAITFVLAIFTFVITSINGNKSYWVHMVNTPGVPWWLKLPIPLMPIVEISGMFIKPFVLMVRLFANILAGHIIPLGFYALIFIFGAMAVGAGYGVSVVSIAFTVFLGLLELLVAFIQAYVFTLLSALYFGMATEEHH